MSPQTISELVSELENIQKQLYEFKHFSFLSEETQDQLHIAENSVVKAIRGIQKRRKNEP